MRIIDDDVETLLTLDMSIEEAKRKRSLVQQRTDHLLFDGAPGVSEAELSKIWFKNLCVSFALE